MLLYLPTSGHLKRGREPPLRAAGSAEVRRAAVLAAWEDGSDVGISRRA